MFDQFLLKSTVGAGTAIYQPAEVTEIKRNSEKFLVNLKTLKDEDLEISADYVIAAYGKQNILDKKLKRNFAAKWMKSKNREISFNGIKYHLDKSNFKNFPGDEIWIYADDNIYCGLNPVSDKEITLCFLEKRINGNRAVRDKIKNLIQHNRSLGNLFENKFDEILSELPVKGAGNIYFGNKKAVEDGIFFIGDAARMIAPFTGDGIGMAMYSAKILSALIIQNKNDKYSRELLEHRYLNEWRNAFLSRIKVAFLFQQVILNNFSRKLSIKLIETFPLLLPQIIKSTRSSIKNS
jgi:flavin-dependent dehydrogenase